METLAEKYPHLIPEWDEEMNKMPATQARADDYQPRWWKCDKCGYKYLSHIDTKIPGCPECTGRGDAERARLAKLKEQERIMGNVCDEIDASMPKPVPIIVEVKKKEKPLDLSNIYDARRYVDMLLKNGLK